MQGNTFVNKHFKVTAQIGAGSFGEIWTGIGANGKKVAVKFERQDAKCPQLRHEYKVYRELNNAFGFCSVHHFGTENNFNVLVMDLLGPSLEDLFNICNRKFSLKTVLQIADQLLERVQTLHETHLIHRDIKPANFAIGLNEHSIDIFCVDFGLSKRFRDPKTLKHNSVRAGRSLTGTPRYASIKNHQGIDSSRRDDLESICYMLIYFLKGKLPWQGLHAKTAELKYRLILDMKIKTSIMQLCEGLPAQFAEALAYTRALKFDAKPDIPYLRKIFRDLYHVENLHLVQGKRWDWDGLDTTAYMNRAQQDLANMPPPALRPATKQTPAQPPQPRQLTQLQQQQSHQQAILMREEQSRQKLQQMMNGPNAANVNNHASSAAQPGTQQQPQMQHQSQLRPAQQPPPLPQQRSLQDRQQIARQEQQKMQMIQKLYPPPPVQLGYLELYGVDAEGNYEIYNPNGSSRTITHQQAIQMREEQQRLKLQQTNVANNNTSFTENLKKRSFESITGVDRK